MKQNISCSTKEDEKQHALFEPQPAKAEGEERCVILYTYLFTIKP